MLQRIFGYARKPWRGYRRQQYKKLWNAISRTESDAIIAVSGTLDPVENKNSAYHTLNWITEAAGVKPEDIVLEIGAGFGRVGDLVAPLCKKWIGTDASENMTKVIRRRLAHHSNVETIATSGYDLAPIASSSVDLVYCTTVFMHVDEWDRYAYAREAYRILKPGGRFVADNLNLLSDEGWQVFLAHCEVRPEKRPPHFSRFSTPQELETYFSRAGFLEIRQKPHGSVIVTAGIK